MVILGIDPGYKRIGYGVIQKNGCTLTFLDAGVMTFNTQDRIRSLVSVKNKISKLIKSTKSALVAVEKLYFSKNQKTGIFVAEHRGVVLLAAAEEEVRIKEYTPNEIKAAVSGYGFADKKAVAKMVGAILNIRVAHLIDDATDALAAAITAATRENIESI